MKKLTGSFLAIILMMAAVGMAGGQVQALSESQKTAPVSKSDVRLIMFEKLGCSYCELWNEQVGEIYPKTPEGQFAPLTRILDGEPAIEHIKPIIYTPTFVVMNGDQEVGRILGYPGEEFFWFYLKEILDKTGFEPAS